MFEVFSNKNDSMTICQLKSQRQVQISRKIQKTSPGLQMKSEVFARLEERRQGRKTSCNHEPLRKTSAEVIQFCRCCWDVGSAGLNRDGLLGHVCTNGSESSRSSFPMQVFCLSTFQSPVQHTDTQHSGTENVLRVFSTCEEASIDFLNNKFHKW